MTMPCDLEGHEMNEQRDLEGISALVTGASSGIGSMAGQVGLPGGAAYDATKGRWRQ
jgi:NADP-dependent 3-hydroxy acid dehydrogenase YdfG